MHRYCQGLPETDDTFGRELIIKKREWQRAVGGCWKGGGGGGGQGGGGKWESYQISKLDQHLYGESIDM